jgi:hypothetical protein
MVRHQISETDPQCGAENRGLEEKDQSVPHALWVNDRYFESDQSAFIAPHALYRCSVVKFLCADFAVESNTYIRQAGLGGWRSLNFPGSRPYPD